MITSFMGALKNTKLYRRFDAVYIAHSSHSPRALSGRGMRARGKESERVETVCLHLEFSEAAANERESDESSWRELSTFSLFRNVFPPSGFPRWHKKFINRSFIFYAFYYDVFSLPTLRCSIIEWFTLKCARWFIHSRLLVFVTCFANELFFLPLFLLRKTIVKK